jgi:hypothetical protein
MLAIVANATAADWRKFSAAIIRDAVAHDIPADLAEDIAQQAALWLLKREKPFPPPRDGKEAQGLGFAAALAKSRGRRFGYRSFLPRDAGSRTKDPDEAFKVASRRASRHVPDPSVIAENAERPYRIAPTEYFRDRMKAEGLCDSTAILASYGVGPQALAEPGCTPDVVQSMGHQPPNLTRGVRGLHGQPDSRKPQAEALEGERLTEYRQALAEYYAGR